MSDLPKAVKSGVIDLMGMKLRTHVLDNGQRVIDAEDAEKFFELLQNGEVTLNADQATELAKFIKGAE